MRAVLRWMAIGAGLVLVVTAGLGWASYRKFSGNLRTDRAAEQVLARYAKDRPRALAPRARNILVLGAGAATGAAPEMTTASGTTIGPQDAAVLLHLSADRRRAAAVAVPDPLEIGAPGCGRTFRAGGAACSIRAFERFSGIRVDHHLVVDRAGLERMERIARTQWSAGGGGGRDGGGGGSHRRDLLRTLTKEARGALGPGTLHHPVRFFGLADAATSSITADPGLSSLPALYELAGSLNAVPERGLEFRTLPARHKGSAGAAGGAGTAQYAAEPLLAALRTDRPLPKGSG